MDVCACLLLCFVSMFVYLDLDFAMLCALFGLVFFGFWGYLLVWLHMSLLWFAWVWPLMRHISVMLVCLIHTFLHSMWWCYACLANFVPPVWLSLLLCIFARLPTCSCMSLCLLMSSSLIPTNLYRFITRLWYTRPQVPLGILLDRTCVVHTPILWNYGHPIQTYILPPRTPSFVW